MRQAHVARNTITTPQPSWISPPSFDMFVVVWPIPVQTYQITHTRIGLIMSIQPILCVWKLILYWISYMYKWIDVDFYRISITSSSTYVSHEHWIPLLLSPESLVLKYPLSSSHMYLCGCVHVRMCESVNDAQNG